MKHTVQSMNVHLFGPFRIRVGDEHIHLGIAGVTRDILTYLLLNPGAVFRRDMLANLFWPDSTTAQARAALSTALWRLHKSCAEILGLTVESSENLIWLKADDDIYIDIRQLEYWQRQAQIHRRTDLRLSDTIRRNLTACVENCQGQYLDGCEEDWARAPREDAMTLRLNTINQLIDDAQERGRLSSAIRLAQLGLKDDPLHEWLHHRLIQLYAESSQRSKAIMQFETLKDTLANELGISPLPETLELRNSIISVSSLPGASPIPAAATENIGRSKTTPSRG